MPCPRLRLAGKPDCGLSRPAGTGDDVVRLGHAVQRKPQATGHLQMAQGSLTMRSRPVTVISGGSSEPTSGVSGA